MSGGGDRPVALVTGAAGGIGSATVRRLAKDHAVLATDRDGSGLDALRAEGIEVTQADLTDPEAPDRLIAAALDRWGRIDALVNNAAFHGTRQSVLATTPAEWRAVFAVNVLAAAALAAAAARDMARRKSGTIVNVGSVQLALPAPGYAAYVASKGAVEGLTRALAVELAPLGIRVNAVAPGVIVTPHYQRELTKLGVGAAPSLASLSGQGGTPGDVAEAIAFLLGPGARFIAGATLAVDGGRAISRRSDPFQAELPHPPSGVQNGPH